MTHMQVLALGTMMMSAAHYVRDGASGWMALWWLGGCVVLAIDNAVVPQIPEIIGRAIMNSTLTGGQGTGS